MANIFETEKFLSIQERELENFNNVDTSFFIEFYNDIDLDKLKNIFALCHRELNGLFSFMNIKKNQNGHFNADESRQLKHIIEFVEGLEKKLKYHESEWAFNIEDYYKEIFELCKSFLVESGGSSIPEDFPKIELIDFKPIFFIENKITLDSVNFHESVPLKEVSKGSYALVYKFKDPNYGSHVALKKAFQTLNTKELDRFKLEFETLKKLDSPFIIKAYHYDEQNNEYLMELADCTLEHYIISNNTKITNNKRVNLVRQILRAFQYIHSKNLLHRDISYGTVNNFV